MGSSVSREKTFGLSKEDHLLYSPKLLDLEHGTIRHRDKEMATEEDVRQGYFYHAQLTDWSDDTCIKDFQKTRVVEGSKKDANSKLFYVYAKGMETDVVDHGIRKEKPKPKGLGYRWRGDSEHKYYRIRFSKRRADEDSDSEAEELHGLDTVYRIHPKPGLTAQHLSEILSLKFLVPEHLIHFVYKTQKLGEDTVLGQLNPHYVRCKVELKLMTDVEIVKHGYDDDERAPEENNHVIMAANSVAMSVHHSEDVFRDSAQVTRDIDHNQVTRDSEPGTRDLLLDAGDNAMDLESNAARETKLSSEKVVDDVAVLPISLQNPPRDVTDSRNHDHVTRESEDVTRESEDVTRESEDVTRDPSIVPHETEERPKEVSVNGQQNDVLSDSEPELKNITDSGDVTDSRVAGQSPSPGTIF